MNDFREPRDVIPLIPEALAMLASEVHRLHHAAWHDVRGQWLALSEAKRAAIRSLNWQPGHSVERPAVRRGAPIVDNGSGEDFLYMHREMIGMVRAIYGQAGKPPIAGWGPIPLPGGPASDGFDIPPNWTQSHAPTMRRLAALKSDEYFWSSMRAADRQFKNAAYLSSISLGALGATIEYTVHNDMHMRWASAPRDPSTGEVKSDGRLPTDFDTKWLHPSYDFLGEFFSSHVNPVFWRLHGWVDDRIEEWFAAHETAHPGEVERSSVDGVEWFRPGRWVSDVEPWAKPKSGHGHGGHGHGGHGGLDPSVMKQVIGILYAPDGAAPSAALTKGGIGPPRGTWFLT